MYTVAILIGSFVGLGCGCFAEQLFKDKYGPDYFARLRWRGYAIVGGAMAGGAVGTIQFLLWLGRYG